ncbi:MAG: cytochrome c oxidase accessory protein CcoG [Phycisphaerales bacterium]
MTDTLIQPPDRVLSTLNADGSRRWLRPKPSRGAFWKWRLIVGWALIVIFTALPWIPINGKPAILLNIVRREFTFFGKTFLPTDTLLLALLLIGLFLSIFFVTALFGRVWCGWMCPQTVYLEFVYRPIERLFEGEPGRRKPKKNLGARKVARFAVYLLVSMFLAHTFLSYFVGVGQLRHWILGSPFEHPVPFLTMAIVTGLMLFDFGYFREQVCVVMCPYARMQSALLDRDSLIVTYDAKRGEPRGKRGKKRSTAPSPEGNGDVSLAVLPDEPGDCVDCTLCVQTCPTGIDIRDGLQMECVGCAQCIDACDDVMTRLGKATGLIRYSSQRAIEDGASKLIRPRVLIYPVLLVVIVTAFIVVLSTKSNTDVQVLRAPGLPFNTLSTGEVSNQIRVRITNRKDEAAEYTLSAVGPEGVRLEIAENPITIDAGEQRWEKMLILAPPAAFSNGHLDVAVRITNGTDYDEQVPYRMLGPAGGFGSVQPAPAAPDTNTPAPEGGDG